MKIAFDAVVITYEKGKVDKELVPVTAGSIEDLGLAVLSVVVVLSSARLPAAAISSPAPRANVWFSKTVAPDVSYPSSCLV